MAEKKPVVPSAVERGKYLVTIAVCNDCHTPKVEGPGGTPVLDEKRLLSGHPEKAPFPSWTPDDLKQRSAMAMTNPMLTAWAGPWGVSFASNLTPDKETGIAEWGEEHFIQALRTGKHQGQLNGRDILPPMPWQFFKSMTDEDLKAIFAYLRTLKPIAHVVVNARFHASQFPNALLNTPVTVRDVLDSRMICDPLAGKSVADRSADL